MQAFYRYPGPHKIGNYGDDIGFEWICLDASEIDRMVSNGWSLTPDDAIAAFNSSDSESATCGTQEQSKRRGRPPKAKDDQETISC